MTSREIAALLVVPCLVVALLVVPFTVGACAGPGAPASPRPPTSPVELDVLAAASLGDAIGAAATAYEASHPGATLVLSTDSSAALEAKIEQGAPADVFLSADTENPQKLVDRGFAAGPPTRFASNTLVVIVPGDNPGGITSPRDLAQPGVMIIAAGPAVPITRYASQLIANLAHEPGYPADFEARYAANVVSEEDNVRAVVAKIALGQGDAAIVYATDPSVARDVRIIEIPPAANVPASYAGVIVGASDDAAAARSFLDWLVGVDGQAILAGFGFQPPISASAAAR